ARFCLSEAPREGAGAALREIERLGVRVAVLTGDGAAAARALGERVGVADVRAGLRPAEKLAGVAAARRAGAVAMLGDGVNDAPSLAAADVGIAVGGGTDLARSSAPVVLAGDDPAQVAWLLRLARRVGWTVRANLFWAVVYNAVGIG